MLRTTVPLLTQWPPAILCTETGLYLHFDARLSLSGGRNGRGPITFVQPRGNRPEQPDSQVRLIFESLPRVSRHHLLAEHLTTLLKRLRHFCRSGLLPSFRALRQLSAM